MASDSDIRLAQAGSDQAGQVARLVHGLLAELSGGDGPPLDEVADSTARLLEQGSIEAVLAFAGTRPVGVITLNECAAIYAGGAFGEICELYVDPEFRSQRVAPLLIAEAKAIGRRRGWRRLEVGAPDQPAWQRTLAFYLREEFEEVGPRLKVVL